MRTAAALMLSLALAGSAFAHGPAQWIQDGRFTNKAGELCCGERDCGEWVKDSGRIVPTATGYRVDGWFRGSIGGVPFTHEVHELIPYSEAQPSPDGVYWRCQWGGSRKCFFAPPPGS